MSLITDKVFYNALRSNAALMAQVGGRIESTSIPVPDEQLDNEPVPFIIITFVSCVIFLSTFIFAISENDKFFFETRIIIFAIF